MDIKTLNERSLQIFNKLVDAYVELGEPIGSRTLSKRLEQKLSPATIRNIMADLEEQGFLYSPHTSAGRVPTEKGLRFFVDGLLTSQNLQTLDYQSLKKECEKYGKNFDDVIDRTSSTLSGLSKCASIIMAPKFEQAQIKHIEFLPLNENKGLVILVLENGIVENRIIKLPHDITPGQLIQASNYINQHLSGKPLHNAQKSILKELEDKKSTLDTLTTKVVKKGLAIWTNEGNSLIVKGQSNLLHNIQNVEDLESIRTLFAELEAKENINKLIEASLTAEGIKLFIGSENNLFNQTGCSMVMSPYHNAKGTIVGVVGVIGPMSMNYRRIIPMVDYSAKLISKLMQS